MEFLTGYGSDDSEPEETPCTTSNSETKLFLPTPNRTASQGLSVNRPPVQRQEENDAPGPSGGSLLAKLPTPSESKVARKVIAFQLPLSKSMLAPDSDDDEDAEQRRAAKRLKAANKTKSKLMDYLPPPKNDKLLGAGFAGSSASGAGTRGRPPKGFFSHDVDDEEDPVLAAGRGDGGAAAVGLSNEAYRADDDDTPVAGPHGGWESHAAHGPQPAAYGFHGAGPSAHAVPKRAANQDLQLPDELAGVQFKEINQKELRYVDPARKEAANSLRNVLGEEFANKMRSQAQSHVGSKLARSKHQIGTLFFNAKMNELDILEGKAHSMKTKSETQAKYGW